MNKHQAFREALEKRKKGQQGNRLSTTKIITLHQDLIAEAISEGYTKKDIWESLVESEILEISYSVFTRALRKNNSSPSNKKLSKETNPEKAGSTSETKDPHQTTEEKPKPKRKPIYNPPEEKKGFVHNPIARKDLC